MDVYWPCVLHFVSFKREDRDVAAAHDGDAEWLLRTRVCSPSSTPCSILEVV